MSENNNELIDFLREQGCTEASGKRMAFYNEIAERVEYLRYTIRPWSSLIHVSTEEGDEDFHLNARLFFKVGDKFVYRTDVKNPVYPEIPFRPLMEVLK